MQFKHPRDLLKSTRLGRRRGWHDPPSALGAGMELVDDDTRAGAALAVLTKYGKLYMPVPMPPPPPRGKKPARRPRDVGSDYLDVIVRRLAAERAGAGAGAGGGRDRRSVIFPCHQVHFRDSPRFLRLLNFN